MNSHQRRVAKRKGLRDIEKYAREYCIKYSIDPEKWGSTTIKWPKWLSKAYMHATGTFKE